MKIEEQNVATFNMGIKESAQANIHVNAKMFEILSGVYSDPELAIVREIGANAQDSHTKAGHPDKPFRVQVPNALDPRFVVRDFGTGMSHEFVMTKLNSYGESTKDDSNDEIGGFGLGIKCPFSYTSSFMIACYQDGVRRVYAYQIGKKGIPEINFMAESATTEENGVEVSVPVKAEDYAKFSTAIQKTFAFYDVKPTIRGVELNIPEFQKIAAGPGWFICKRSKMFDGQVFVEMGGIAYPVEQRTHGIGYYGYDQTLFLTANIGEIDITPNREQIKITDKTTKFVKNAIETLKQEVFDELQKQVDELDADCYWDIVPTLASMTGGFFRAMDLKVENVKYKGKKYDDNDFTVAPAPQDIVKDDGTVVPADIKPHHVEGMGAIQIWERRSEHRVKKETPWGGHKFSLNRLSTDNRTVVVIGEGQGAKVGKWLRAGNDRTIIAVEVRPGSTAADVIDGIKERTENYPNIVNAEDIEVEKIARNLPPRKYYLYHTGSYSNVNRTEIDVSKLPETVYYFETDGRQRGTVFGRDVNFNHDTSDFLSTAKQWIGQQIYFLSEGHIKKIQKANPDIELVKADEKMEEMLKDKVLEVAPKYLVNKLTTLEDKFADKVGRWQVDYALSFWSRRYGFTDYIEARKQLREEYIDRTIEKMVKLIVKKEIHDLFAEYGVTVKEVTCTSFDDMLVKMPYATTLARDYSDANVLAHIEEVMGWTVASPAASEYDDED